MPTFLEAGKIVNTHGVRGELKIENYCDNQEFFKKIKTLYLNSQPYNIVSQRSHKTFILAMLEGVDTIEAAMALKNKVVFFDKDSVPLPKGHYYLSEILGFSVFDSRINAPIGTLKDIQQLPSSNIYTIDFNGKDVLIPDVPEFILSVDLGAKQINVKTIYGMLPNED